MTDTPVIGRPRRSVDPQLSEWLEESYRRCQAFTVPGIKGESETDEFVRQARLYAKHAGKSVMVHFGNGTVSLMLRDKRAYRRGGSNG